MRMPEWLTKGRFQIYKTPVLKQYVTDFSRAVGVSHALDLWPILKTFMLVNYNSRVVICGIFQSGTTLEL